MNDRFTLQCLDCSFCGAQTDEMGIPGDLVACEQCRQEAAEDNIAREMAMAIIGTLSRNSDPPQRWTGLGRN